MFDYDKAMKKLGKFGELPEKKKKKLFTTIFAEPEFRQWMFGVGDQKDAQPMNPTMVQKIFSALARPDVVKALTSYIDENSNKLDRTSYTLAFMVVDQGIEEANRANGEVYEESKNGNLSVKDTKSYKQKSEVYLENLAKLMAIIKERCAGEVKDICRKANLPKGLVYTTFFIVPGREFIPKYKITMYMNQILREIYKYTEANGMESIQSIRWGNLFGNFFGMELTTSAAVAVLLEGVKRIEPYQDSENFNNVKSVWNSLTNFALSELDNAPENIRKQMIELYIKKLNNIAKNGNMPTLRVDILELPKSFANLSDTVSRYSNKINSIVGANMKPVTDFKKKYFDRPKQDEDEDDERVAAILERNGIKCIKDEEVHEHREIGKYDEDFGEQTLKETSRKLSILNSDVDYTPMKKEEEEDEDDCPPPFFAEDEDDD